MTNAEFARRLRALAEVYMNHEDCPQLYQLGQCGEEIVFAMTKEEAAAAVRAFGPGAKSDDKDWLDYTPVKYPGIRVKVYKNKVCTRVKVGEKVVPGIVIPAKAATIAVTLPDRVEEVFEWRCGSLLDAGGEDGEVV